MREKHGCLSLNSEGNLQGGEAWGQASRARGGPSCVWGTSRAGPGRGAVRTQPPSTPACARGSTPRPHTCRTCSEGTRTGQRAESPVGPHRPGINRSPWARHHTSRRSPQEEGARARDAPPPRAASGVTSKGDAKSAPPQRVPGETPTFPPGGPADGGRAPLDTEPNSTDSEEVGCFHPLPRLSSSFRELLIVLPLCVCVHARAGATAYP